MVCSVAKNFVTAKLPRSTVSPKEPSTLTPTLSKRKLGSVSLTSPTLSEMEKLLKVYADDCPICKELAKSDKKLASVHNMEFEQMSLDEVAGLPEENNLRGYVIHYHVDDTGMVDIPLYLILDRENRIKSSGSIKEPEQITNLINSWELYKSQMSSVSETE